MAPDFEPHSFGAAMVRPVGLQTRVATTGEARQ
jgi:hypothetical protein